MTVWRGDGDGWLHCEQGHRHWGLHGAAGLLLRRETAGGIEVLLQHRAAWSHHGDTWGLLGGARHSSEDAVSAAVREAGEEGGIRPSDVRAYAQYDDVHGGWTYSTVLAEAAPETAPRALSGESVAVEWVPVDQVTARAVHPGLLGTWPWLRRALQPPTVVVDAANVVGSTPDGWWRDRPAAARRLLTDSAQVARDGLPGSALPEGLDLPPLSRWWPRIVVVLEGAARAAVEDVPAGIEAVAASGSGDDAVVAAAATGTGPVIVVTSDRELRQRCEKVGATCVGTRWWTHRGE